MEGAWKKEVEVGTEGGGRRRRETEGTGRRREEKEWKDRRGGGR